MLATKEKMDAKKQNHKRTSFFRKLQIKLKKKKKNEAIQ